MPLFQLTREIAFPHASLALEDGLLAVGGDLSSERLLLAYANGIFPWYCEGDPILWWSPDPRMVLIPSEFHAPRRLIRTAASEQWSVTCDTCFDRVLIECARSERTGQDGTWITDAMRQSYGELHRLGFAHSVEAWHGEELAGGLYGVSLGGCFFGESMFTRRTDGSKIALLHLVERLREWDFDLIDCQMRTEHLATFGAREIPRGIFLETIQRSLQRDSRAGPWDAQAANPETGAQQR